MLFLFHFAEAKNLYLLLSKHIIVIVNIEKIIPNRHVINNGKHLLFNKLIKIKIKGKAKKRNPRIKEKIIIKN
jgi:hypothetical protein